MNERGYLTKHWHMQPTCLDTQATRHALQAKWRRLLHTGQWLIVDSGTVGIKDETAVSKCDCKLRGGLITATKKHGGGKPNIDAYCGISWEILRQCTCQPFWKFIPKEWALMIYKGNWICCTGWGHQDYVGMVGMILSSWGWGRINDSPMFEGFFSRLNLWYSRFWTPSFEIHRFFFQSIVRPIPTR